MKLTHLLAGTALLGTVLTAPLCAAESAAKRVANPFYAMDTAFRRAGLTTDQQLDLVKELGFSGIAWTEAPPEQVAATLLQVEKRGLKMSAIYCAASVTPEGKLSHSPQLTRLMETLKGRGTLVWLHVGGKGPAFDKLTDDEPLVAGFRKLADTAVANGLRLAVYPHVGEWTARFGDATRLALVVKHPGFGVSFNLCHALAMGDEKKIPALIEAAKPVLFTVTINGADAGVNRADWGRLIQPLGKGTFDNAPVLRKLAEIGFTGPVGFQGYGIPGDARSILGPTMKAWLSLTEATAPGQP